MQTERLNDSEPTIENTPPENIITMMQEAFAREQPKVKPTYPRYFVKHNGPNRKARRDMKFGRSNPDGWVEEK